MKFEIPFNKQIYKEQMELNFNTAWKDNLQKNKKRLFYGIPIVLIGLLIAYVLGNTSAKITIIIVIISVA